MKVRLVEELYKSARQNYPRCSVIVKDTPNWSSEVFTVTQVLPTKPYMYHLKDYQDKPIAGGFYEEELLKTKYPDIYLIEKGLKKSGNRVYVKKVRFASK